MSISWLTINAPNYGSYKHCTWILRQWNGYWLYWFTTLGSLCVTGMWKC